MVKITVLIMVNEKVVVTCMMILIMDDYCIYLEFFSYSLVQLSNLSLHELKEKIRQGSHIRNFCQVFNTCLYSKILIIAFFLSFKLVYQILNSQ